MKRWDDLLIAVDAGHGGWDNGARLEGRLEKDDNLTMAIALRDELEAQCIRVLMTRESDVFVELKDRADMANDANADLFISLHRNSYTKLTPGTAGIENWIYLTAPVNTTERAASLVLGEVAGAGVQGNRGVRRGNYYVLRKTKMPAMLFENGYIINSEDNRLYDLKLHDYARAMTAGIMRYFGFAYDESKPCRLF